MGRWGNGLYDSDYTLDYLIKIDHRLVRDFLFRTSTEATEPSSVWLNNVLTIIEITLLLDKHVGVRSYAIVQCLAEWETTFLGIWDADWNESGEDLLPFSKSTYRQKHRRVIDHYFERFRLQVAFDEDDVAEPLPPYNLNYQLPYFSRIIPSYHGLDGISDFVSNLVTSLIHEVAFAISEENRRNMYPASEEDVWVTIDLIGLLCQAYKLSPHITPKFVDSWQKKVINIWKEENGLDELPEGDKLYKEVKFAFERLRQATIDYPVIAFLDPDE